MPVDAPFYDGDGDYYAEENGEYIYIGFGAGCFDEQGNFYANVSYNHEKYGEDYFTTELRAIATNE